MTRQLVAEEIAEAFRPVETWQFAAPVERTLDLTLAMQDTLTTLAWWGWSITVTRARGLWTIQAGRTMGNKAIRAKVTGTSFPDALWRLGNRLEAVLAGAEMDDETEMAA